MSQICSPTKTIYLNGMTTSYTDARACADLIEEISKSPVDLIHNNTTSSDRTTSMLAKVVIGSFGLYYAITSEKKSQEKKFLDATVAFFSVGLIILAFIDYEDIQKEKNHVAKSLANRMVKFLGKNPHSHVALVLHSQGADIALRSLKQITGLNDRIRVITIGGMVPIPDQYASKVVNFQGFDDVISRLAQAVFGSIHSGSRSVNMIERTGHDATKYLNHKDVVKALKRMTSDSIYIKQSRSRYHRDGRKRYARNRARISSRSVSGA